MYKSITYSTWRAMRRRCHDEKHKDFQRWGALGITVCNEWQGPNGFINFLRDMGERPGKNFSIDRIDGTGNYNKENCRWATQSEQNKNQKKRNATTRRAFDWDFAFELYAEGFRKSEIAALFGVTNCAVVRVIKHSIKVGDTRQFIKGNTK